MIKVDWGKVGGLLPVVVQDAGDGVVLMMAYMNEEALALTLESGFAHYFSRTKNRIWKKGETSGNEQIVKSAFLDCDCDTLLLKVEQKGGAACHTGERSCFYNEISLGGDGEILSCACGRKQSANSVYNVLDEVYHVCLERKLKGDANSSYVVKLYQKGENSYLKKISEEACEFALACKDLTRARESANASVADKMSFGEHKPGEPEYDVVYEGADILFHMLVALANHRIHPEMLLRELVRRDGISGIDEKNSRKG